MVVLHVIDGISRLSGGPSRSVQGLVSGLNAAGGKTWLMTLNRGDEPWIGGISHFENGGVFEEVMQRVSPDVVHIHGLWNMGLHRCAVICRRWGVPYIIAPRGMLEPWSLRQKWFKKRIARWLYQDRDLQSAAALHATADSEASQLRKLGFKNPIIISPNGVNVPKNFSRAECVDRKRALFVSRMHPKKGVIELVEAWNEIKQSSNTAMANWICELVYTMSGELEKGYEAKVRSRVKELGLQDQFIFSGPLNDDEKWQAYARADLFVLPTYSENFGIVVAEALWAGVPVITTKGTPWSELGERNCGWWINIGVDHLADALKDAMLLDDAQRHQMGARGRLLVQEKYTWGAVVKAMLKGYAEVLNGRA